MTTTQQNIDTTLTQLFADSKYDKVKIIKGAAKSIFRPMQPTDFKDAYLSISEDQGKYLAQLIMKNNYKNIVEFGTSFGISALFMARGVLETGGKIITTELIESKAQKAKENFKQAGVHKLIDVRIGDAMQTLAYHKEPIDLLFLDGWKDLYLPLFKMLEPNFHDNTLIYVDNADIKDTQDFLKVIAQNDAYSLQTKYHGKVVLITTK